MQFPKNARVCFVGDSITANNQIVMHVIDFYNRNFPKDNVRFFNCGIPGGTCKTALEHLETDVLRHKPTHIVLEFGINDSGYGIFQKRITQSTWDFFQDCFEEYKKNLKTLCEISKEKNISVILCTPAPYDEYSEHDTTPKAGMSASMAAYAQYVRGFAHESGLPLCDYHQALSKALRTGEEILYYPDRVHPNDRGSYLMAKCFLDCLGMELGEQQAFPDYFQAWTEIVLIKKKIYTVEIMYPFHMPLQEKIEKVKARLQSGEQLTEYLRSALSLYVEHRENLEDLYQKAEYFYERDVHVKN